MNIGKLGIWSFVNMLNAADAAALAQRIEQWGYDMLWIPEALGRDPMVTAAWIFAHTQRLNVGTGIANIYARDALAMVESQYGLAEMSSDRFLLGLGVSHKMMVEDMRGHTYEKPLGKMQHYLEAMAASSYFGVPPADKPKTILAALGPKMLQLAAELADGILSYNVTPQHTAEARKILGPGKLLCAEQMVILESDPTIARTIARNMLGMYVGFPNYQNNFKRLGFVEADFEEGGSDRLIDAIVVWGDEQAIRERIQQHWDAGADHVCIQSLPREGMTLQKQDEKIFELLAPAKN